MRASPGGSLVLVEDNGELRELLADALRESGWSVIEFSTGTGALEFLCGGGTASVILLDLVLKPDMTGWQLLELLRVDARWRELPVIAVSGAELPEPERSRLSPQGFLRKPFEMAQLNALLGPFRSHRPPSSGGHAHP